MATLGMLVLAGCESPVATARKAAEPPPSFMAGGNGGGKGGGGGNGGASEATPVVVLRATTTAGLTNAFQGDGRDVDGSLSSDGESRYQDGQCGINVGLDLTSTDPDTMRVDIHIATSLKRKDPCTGGARLVTVEFPPNPIFSSTESLGSFQWKWEPEAAPTPGAGTSGLGKINIRNQPDTCSPLRYNPLKYDGLFSESDFVRLERIEGGWRLFTAPSPENVAQCEDRSSAGGNGESEAGETIPLDFELLVDENAGDGVGPAG